MSKIYRVDDGSVWHIVATDTVDARRRWLVYAMECYGSKDEAEAIGDYGEPDIRLVQPADAEKIKIVTDESEPCEHCRGSGTQAKKVTVGDAFREYMAATEDRKALHGILCNSEWP